MKIEQIAERFFAVKSSLNSCFDFDLVFVMFTLCIAFFNSCWSQLAVVNTTIKNFIWSIAGVLIYFMKDLIPYHCDLNELEW